MDAAPPFFEASTGHEWVVTLRFRVAGGTFATEAIRQQLGLEPFDRLTTPVLCDQPRVAGAPVGAGYREVAITAHAADELLTPAFDAFVHRAATSYLRGGDPDDGWAGARARMAELIGGGKGSRRA